MKKVYDYMQKTLDALFDQIANWCFDPNEDVLVEGFDIDGFNTHGFSPEGLDRFGFDAEGKICLDGYFYRRSDFRKITIQGNRTSTVYLYTNKGIYGTTIVLKERILTCYNKATMGYRFSPDGLGTASIRYAIFDSYGEFKKARETNNIDWYQNKKIEK